MPGNIEVWYSNHHLVNGPVFRPPFEHWSAIQMHHFNNEKVKVYHSNVSAIQMVSIQIPTVLVRVALRHCKRTLERESYVLFLS